MAAKISVLSARSLVALERFRTTNMTGRVYIGIAGWSYPDWMGIVYTERKQDQLKFISGLVDCVEINSTFYRPPGELQVQSW